MKNIDIKSSFFPFTPTFDGKLLNMHLPIFVKQTSSSRVDSVLESTVGGGGSGERAGGAGTTASGGRPSTSPSSGVSSHVASSLGGSPAGGAGGTSIPGVGGTVPSSASVLAALQASQLSLNQVNF